MSIHFTYKDETTLLRVLAFPHGPVTLGAGLETRFPFRDDYHGIYGLQAAAPHPHNGAPVPVALVQSGHCAPSSPPDVNGGDTASSATRCSRSVGKRQASNCCGRG